MSTPDVPSVEVKKPKRGLFGGLTFKKPSLLKKSKVQEGGWEMDAVATVAVEEQGRLGAPLCTRACSLYG